MATYDLFIYRDFTDNVNDDTLQVGEDAGSKLGAEFEGLRVVARTRPLHYGR